MMRPITQRDPHNAWVLGLTTGIVLCLTLWFVFVVVALASAETESVDVVAVGPYPLPPDPVKTSDGSIHVPIQVLPQDPMTLSLELSCAQRDQPYASNILCYQDTVARIGNRTTIVKYLGGAWTYHTSVTDVGRSPWLWFVFALSFMLGAVIFLLVVLYL